MMKKQILILSAVAALTVGVLNSAVADTSGALTFTGSVTESTCGIPTAQMTQTIPFGNLNLADVIAAIGYDTITDAYPLTFDVSNCGTATTANLKFDYTADGPSGKNYYIANNVTDGAKGIGAMIFKKEIANGDQNWASADTVHAGDTLPISLTAGAGSLNLWANMVRENTVASSAVASGDYSGVVTLTLTTE